MGDPNDPIQVYTIGIPGPSGLPMVWQGALAITAAQSPYQAKILQPVPVDCRSASVTVLLPALTDASTTVVAIKDLYGASATFPIIVQATGGATVEDPSNGGTFISAAPWPRIAMPGAPVVWFVGMFSINAWVIWAGV
jgi:hypothetical protein